MVEQTPEVTMNDEGAAAQETLEASAFNQAAQQ